MAVRATNPGAYERAGESRRAHGRIVCDGVSLRIGKKRGFVIDMSGSGARVEIGGDETPVGQVVDCTLSCGDESVTLSAKVVRRYTEKSSGCRLGLRFVDMTDDHKRNLLDLLRTAMSRRMIG